MTIQMSDKEAQIEREQVEWVFGLTGGELADKPVTYIDGDDKEGVFRYTYDGVPDYATSDYNDLYDSGIDYFTAVVYKGSYGWTAEHNERMQTLHIGGKTYKQVSEFNSSGETECGYRGCEEGDLVTVGQAGTEDHCPYCEEVIGEEHGYIYLGDGWCEVVYRHSDEDDWRALAAAHNMEVWQDDALTFYCDGPCQSVQTWPAAAVAANSGACPECRSLVTDDSPDVAKGKWWFWCCAPGCLPEGPAQGPYDDEIEALEAAAEGLGE